MGLSVMHYASHLKTIKSFSSPITPIPRIHTHSFTILTQQSNHPILHLHPSLHPLIVVIYLLLRSCVSLKKKQKITKIKKN